jgi:N6-adenosine-specific RNA methylase IME4
VATRRSERLVSTRYRTIVADPPWEIPFGSSRTPPTNGGWADEKWARAEVRDLPYPTMTTEIVALPVGEWAEPDAHLYVWTVNRHLESTYWIVRAWGFRPAQILTWCKAPMGLGLGGAFTPTTEHVLFARRGVLPPTSRVDSTWWQWKRGEHSAKPEAFLDMVEQVSPGPYLEMFSRRARFCWDYWGDESLGTATLEAS